MSFASPLFLLALLVVPLRSLFALVVDRRRARYPVAFTNLDVLAGVVEQRRVVAALGAARAAPARARRSPRARSRGRART